MKGIRKIRLVLLVTGMCLVNIISASGALAAQTVGPVPITKIRTGWAADAFVIVTNPPIANPANCATADGYMSVGLNPGYKTYYAATLMAFALGKPVTVVINDTECVSGRPMILGVYVAQ